MGNEMFGIIAILPVAAAMAFICRREIGDTIAPAIMGVLLWLYVFGLFGALLPGFYLALGIAGACLLYVIWRIIQCAGGRRSIDVPAVSLRRQLLSPGLFAWAGFALLFFLFNYNRYYIHSVDFMHYGLSLRDLLRLDVFSNAKESADLFPFIPPGNLLWSYYSLRLTREPSEGMALFSQELLQSAFVLPLFSSRAGQKTTGKRALVLWLSLLLLPVAVSEKYAYSTLSPVFLLGFAAAYIVRQYRRYRAGKSTFDLITLLLAAWYVAVTGYIGMAAGVALFVALLLAEMTDVRHRKSGTRTLPFRKTLPLWSMTGAFLTGVLSWRGYLAVTGSVNNPVVQQMREDALPAIEGKKNPLVLLFTMLQGLSDTDTSGIIGHVLPISVLSLLVLIAIGLLICRHVSVIRKHLPATFLRPYLWILPGVAVYFLVLYCIYLFRVPAARAYEQGYLDLAVIPAVTFLLLFLLENTLSSFGESQPVTGIFWQTVLWISLLSVNLGSILLLALDQPQTSAFPTIDVAYKRDFRFAPGDRLYLIYHSDAESTADQRRAAETADDETGALYYTLTEDTQVYMNLSGQDLRHWEDGLRAEDSAREVADTLRMNGYQYVYITGRGERFRRLYSSLFTDEVSRDDGIFFNITAYEDNTVQLATEERFPEWLQIDGVWYYYDSAGNMQTGWVKVGGKWYYLDDSGAMQTGWLTDNDKQYYLTDSGAMKTGWLNENDKWYYFNRSGVMQTGWVKTGGKWYYLDDSGVMLANTSRNIDGKTYRFDDSGACLNP